MLVAHNPRLSRHVAHNPQTLTLSQWGMWPTTPIYRGTWATTPKREHHPAPPRAIAAQNPWGAREAGVSTSPTASTSIVIS